MSAVLTEAKAFLAKAESMSRDAFREAYKKLPAPVRQAYRRLQNEKMCNNPQEDLKKEYVSPSGAYKLVVIPHKTREGSWNVTEGLVYRQGSDKPIERVCRNYSSFPFLWVEPHNNGHSYLVCGEDYQGQTVIELDTGKRRDHLPEAATEGFGFCWVHYKYDPGTDLITVAGCIWAAPYEYRFYDFSDPMAGWSGVCLEYSPPDDDEEEEEDDDDEGSCIYDDDRWPTFESDGTIKCYQSESRYDDDEDDEDETKEMPVASVRTFKREGLKLIKAGVWVSDKEQKKRADRKEANRKYEAKLAKWKAEDPLYLAHRELQKNPVLSQGEWASRGITHDGWCPDFKKREPRHCHRILAKKTSKYTVDLEWATETGPIKLIIYKDGKTFETLWFEHSVEGMEKAYAHARGLVS